MNASVITPEELASAEKFEDFMPVYKVDANTVVKTGDCVRLAEAAALNLVRAKTTISVPEVYNAYTDPATGHVRIVMRFIEGDRVADVWDKFSAEQKQQVTEHLRDFLSQLRHIKGSLMDPSMLLLVQVFYLMRTSARTGRTRTKHLSTRQ
jgi:hypothetical protein